MNIAERFEKFYEKQPPLLFIDELKAPLHTKVPEWFKREKADCGEVVAKSAYIINEFTDDEGLLETAFEDFNLFLEVYKINGNEFPIYIKKENTDCFEAYKISVNKDGCVITANDAEGIRRALVYLEDEFNRREGPILPIGEIYRKPRIKSRITRGFFSPTNRPPKNIDELLNDVNYYPDEYLNRLAHDGTNGIWIYSRLSDLVKTDIIPEYGLDSDKRIAKLKKIIDRCKRYGIKVYILFIEPASLPDELYKKHPDMGGIFQWWSNSYTFCTSSENGAKYCIEAMQKLCESLPELGGIIDISVGERLTTCASITPDLCPRCRGKSRAEVLAHTVDLLREGMRRANTKAEFISWSYGHRDWELAPIAEYVEKTPKDVIIMQSFEEKGVATQLGKERIGIDYWLSYTGPSERYKISADIAKKTGKEMYAKMQVCCSHELATVPYIPVPGILFDKYNTNVSGVMQCWYFGNYPSLMSKAAGELSFIDDFSDKKGFLKHLAGIYFGNGQAEDAVNAWKFFEEGYKNYPFNIMFSYYGPAHDGVVWELQLKPKNYPLSRSWLYKDAAEGDRIGECLFNCHTIDETVTLLGLINKNWNKGLEVLPSNVPKEQASVAKALSVLFASAENIMNFYRLRYILAENPENSLDILNQMKKLVYDEIENSKKMIPLCEEDYRLGYHSEAESFKFFPAQLKKRINSLNTLLNTEFTEVEERIKNGLFPLEYFLGEKDAYKMTSSLDDAKKVEIEGADAYFKIAYDKENIYLELDGKKESQFEFRFEYIPTILGPDIRCKDGSLSLISSTVHGYFGNAVKEEENKYKCTAVCGERDIYNITISRAKVGWIKDTPIKFRISNNWILWKKSENSEPRLHIGCLPDEFGWLMP